MSEHGFEGTFVDFPLEERARLGGELEQTSQVQAGHGYYLPKISRSSTNPLENVSSG